MPRTDSHSVSSSQQKTEQCFDWFSLLSTRSHHIPLFWANATRGVRLRTQKSRCSSSSSINTHSNAARSDKTQATHTDQKHSSRVAGSGNRPPGTAPRTQRVGHFARACSLGKVTFIGFNVRFTPSPKQEYFCECFNAGSSAFVLIGRESIPLWPWYVYSSKDFGAVVDGLQACKLQDIFAGCKAVSYV